MGNLAWQDWLVFGAYLVTVTAVGLWAGRHKRSGQDYFLAGRRIPWFVIGTSLVASSISSDQFIGSVGYTYKVGLVAANWEWVAFPMYTMFIFLFLPLYMRTRVTTMPEFLSRRFGAATRNVATLLVIAGYMLVSMTAVIYAGSLAIGEMFHAEQWFGDAAPYAVIWSMVAFTGLLILYGGSSSVAWTDFVQCILLIAGGSLLFFLALSHVEGGWSGMVAQNPERFHLIQPVDHEEVPWPIIPIAVLTIGLYYASCNQFLVQRVLCARSEWDSRMGVVFAGLLGFLRPVAVCFAGLAAFALFNGTPTGDRIAETPDLAFPVLVTEFAPPWIRGLVLAGLVAAIISTLEALANSTTTLIVVDVLKGMLRLPMDERRTLRTGRIVCGIVIVLAGLCAPVVAQAGSIFKYVNQGATYLNVPIAAVFLAGILLPFVTPTASLVAILIGAPLGMLVQYLLFGHVIGVSLAGMMYTAGIVFVMLMLTMVYVSALTRPRERTLTEGTIWRPSDARLPAEERARPRPWYARYFLWYVVFGVVFVLIYAWFW